VLDPRLLARDGTDYLLREPERGLGSLAVALALAYVGTAFAAWIRFRRQPPTIQLGGSAWHVILNPGKRQERPAPRDPDVDRLAYLTVGLKSGVALSGWPYVYTVEPSKSAERELVLANPIYVRPAGATEFQPIGDQLVFVMGSEISSISASYYRVPPEPRQRFRRLKEWKENRRRAKEHRDLLRALD
jgi:hypothetical protein